jgi:hypothetical protein
MMTHDDGLAELVHQQQHRAPWLSEDDLRRAWDRHFDDVLAARAEEQAEATAWELIAGLLEDDHQVSIAAMRRVLVELNGDDTVCVVKALFQILMRHLGVDHNDPEYGHVSVGEADYSGLAELTDGDDMIDLLLNVLKLLMHVIGRDELRSRIQTQLGESLT